MCNDCNGMAINIVHYCTSHITEPYLVVIQFDWPLIGWNLFRGYHWNISNKSTGNHFECQP